jgi:hypothetical protein
MATKLANAERELAQLRTTSRSAEFELVGKQQVRLATALRRWCCMHAWHLRKSACPSLQRGYLCSYLACKHV